MRNRVIQIVSLVAIAGCGSTGGTQPAAPASTQAVDPKGAEATAGAGAEPLRNPGGMWMPQQMPGQASLLQRMGLTLDPKALSDLGGPILPAIVSLGGCTASFVSAEGLIVTNHHCVQRALELNSTAKDNLLENGFLAKTRDQERSAGPSQRVYVPRATTDITEQILKGLADVEGGAARQDELERRQKAAVAACEEGRPGIKCKVTSTFGGARYSLGEVLELRDVRLVYVPHRSIGNYGGEVDNWSWPRHTGDYSFYRAYVSPSGEPADYHKDNVPYRPTAHLKVSRDGVKDGDLVIVLGYPGRTSRLQLAQEMERQVTRRYPEVIAKYKEQMELLAPLLGAGGKTSIAAMVRRQSAQNRASKLEGILGGVARDGLLAKKQTQQQQFERWLAAQTTGADKELRSQAAAKIAQLDQLLRRQWTIEDDERLWSEFVSGSRLLVDALWIVEWVEQQALPDAKRKPGFQQRDRQGALAKQRARARAHESKVDRALWRATIAHAMKDPAAKQWLPAALGLPNNATLDDRALDRALDAFYRRTTLDNERTRVALLQSTSAKLARSKDPFVKLALRLWPVVKQRQERDRAQAGELLLLRAALGEAQLAYQGDAIAPDANGTLRISFGNVKGISTGTSTGDNATSAAFTTATEILAKDTGKEPFDSPASLLTAIREERFGPYAAETIGSVPVNFLAVLDTTSGNSGSPVLDARGALVGLDFDSMKQAVASDLVPQGADRRAIVVDLRYVLWIADAIDQADHLLKEMGLEPAL